MSFDVNDYYSSLQSGDVLMAFKGDISSELIGKVLETVESRLDDYNENAKIRKKIYNVLVESLQNLYHHIEVIPEDLKDEYGTKFGMLAICKISGSSEQRSWARPSSSSGSPSPSWDDEHGITVKTCHRSRSYRTIVRSTYRRQAFQKQCGA